MLDFAKVAFAVVSNAFGQRTMGGQFVKVLDFSKVVFAVVRNAFAQRAVRENVGFLESCFCDCPQRVRAIGNGQWEAWKNVGFRESYVCGWP